MSVHLSSRLEAFDWSIGVPTALGAAVSLAVLEIVPALGALVDRADAILLPDDPGDATEEEGTDGEGDQDEFAGGHAC